MVRQAASAANEHRERSGLVRDGEAAIGRAGVSNVDYLLLKGSQDDPEPDSSEYVRICDRFADASLGFVLIDGRLREQCAKAVVPKVAAGGAIVLDNANWYIDWPTRTPRCLRRYRQGPANGHCGAISADGREVAVHVGRATGCRMRRSG